MTDRHAGYVVTLDHDIRKDDAEATIAAIRQIRGVLDVTPVLGGAEISIAKARATADFRDSLIDLLRSLNAL